MYFVQYHPLKEKLRERALSDREALPYLVLWNFCVLLLAILWQIDGYSGFLDPVNWGLLRLIAIGGIFYVYVQNGGASGFDLIQKYYVLGWVVFIRCMLAFILIMVAHYAFVEIYNLYSATLLDDLTEPIFAIILFWRTGVHIRDTAKGEAESPFPPQA